MTQTLIIIIVVIAIIGFRVWRQTRETRWSIVAMWIAPAIFVILTAIIVSIDLKATPFVLVAAVIGLAVGLALGLYQGTHTTVRVDKAARSLYVKVSPIGSLIFVAVLVLRIGLRYVSGGFAAPSGGGAAGGPTVMFLSPNAAMISSGLLALAAGSVIGLRWYMLGRYQEAPAPG